MGYRSADTNDRRKIALHVHNSNEENGEGFDIGSAGIISVFTIFLTAIAVKPATESEASHPATAENQKTVNQK